MKIVWAIVLLLAGWMRAEESRYYLIKAQGVPTGYIKTEQEGPRARNTETFLKTEGKSRSFDYRILEKIFYGEDGQITGYSYEKIWQSKFFSQYHYVFKKNRVEVTCLEEAKRQKTAVLPLRPETYVITDYFSLAGLLKKSAGYPVSLFVLDAKQIGLSSEEVSYQKMTITPKGEKLLVLGEQKRMVDFFLVDWGEISLEIGFDKKEDVLVEIKEPKKQMTIQASDPEAIGKLSETESHSSFLPSPTVPFDLGVSYQYVFYYNGNEIGKSDFSIKKVEERYKVVADTTIRTVSKTHRTESETVYDASLRPISYRMKEDQETQIECDFVLKGVRERFSRKNGMIETFVALPTHFIFLDNNSIHHFALFLPKCRIKSGTKLPICIFHPRRMKSTDGIFHFLENQGGATIAHFSTPYYTVTMQLDEKGRLVLYEQGKLRVILKESR